MYSFSSLLAFSKYSVRFTSAGTISSLSQKLRSLSYLLRRRGDFSAEARPLSSLCLSSLLKGRGEISAKVLEASSLRLTFSSLPSLSISMSMSISSSMRSLGVPGFADSDPGLFLLLLLSLLLICTGSFKSPLILFIAPELVHVLLLLESFPLLHLVLILSPRLSLSPVPVPLCLSRLSLSLPLSPSLPLAHLVEVPPLSLDLDLLRYLPPDLDLELLLPRSPSLTVSMLVAPFGDGALSLSRDVFTSLLSSHLVRLSYRLLFPSRSRDLERLPDIFTQLNRTQENKTKLNLLRTVVFPLPSI
mmetsp:Transcript_34908/g.43127  ORF Transcript_34908/g.43127 Transcript_34908/m.43127 type:complete len:303 (+) Transcript_34908:2054-2962(+)